MLAQQSGPPFGGGAGLIAVCDIGVASEAPLFAFSYVRLGLIPAVIAPYLVRKVGASYARRFCLTGETFSATRARDIGLIHEVVDDEALVPTTNTVLERLVEAAPESVRKTKLLIRQLTQTDEAQQMRLSLKAHAQMRHAAEAREGLHAFLEKRSPKWPH